MPTTPSTGAVHTATVLDRRECANDVIVLGFDAPELVRAARPGQFVMLVPPNGEAAALALGIYESDERRASILFFVVGSRTREIAQLRIGERVAITGPLGNGFTLTPELNDVTIVAGGTGIASVLLAAMALRRHGARVRLLYGARTASLLVERERFAREGCEVIVATDDGSDGHHGYVTDILASSPAPQMILACGPTPMLRAVARIAEERGVPAQLSLEETFACGVGGCWGCVVPLVRTSAQAPSFPPIESGGSDVVYARVCREGPVFLAEELRW